MLSGCKLLAGGKLLSISSCHHSRELTSTDRPLLVGLDSLVLKVHRHIGDPNPKD